MNDLTQDGGRPSSPIQEAKSLCPLATGNGSLLWTDDTQSMLRIRLRSAALLLFFGFFLFLIQKLGFPDGADLSASVFPAHVTVTIISGLAAAALFCRSPIGLTKLRFLELVVFGAPAAYFLWMQHCYGRYCIEEDGYHAYASYLGESAVPWIILIFLYGMFIPNTWERAAAVVSLMAGAPILEAFLVKLKYDPIWDAFSSVAFSSYMLYLILPAVSAVYGTHKIGMLRREALTARSLGAYQLRQLIGVGGMGEVYLAEHTLLKRPCAVKLIRPEKSGDPKAMARFETEVQAMARLTHWNTVEIFDYGHAVDGTFYYAMEYLPGLSLQQVVDRFGPLEPERAVHLLRQVCAALAEAHSLGIVHRDIKPGNIFAAQRGGIFDVAKLLDFGLVKSSDIHDGDKLKITHEGAVVGSPYYAAPETVTGDSPADARTDIYSLGAVAFFVLTGRPVFEGSKPLKVFFAHVHEPPPAPSSSNPAVPACLEAVVLRCLEKNPQDRFRTVEELSDALASCSCASGWTQIRAKQWWSDVANSEDFSALDPNGADSEFRETTLLQVEA